MFQNKTQKKSFQYPASRTTLIFLNASRPYVKIKFVWSKAKDWISSVGFQGKNILSLTQSLFPPSISKLTLKPPMSQLVNMKQPLDPSLTYMFCYTNPPYAPPLSLCDQLPTLLSPHCHPHGYGRLHYLWHLE